MGLILHEPLNVVIVGAGIGGLSAALALRQQGHNVTIYEKSRFGQEVGAAITLPSNITSLLRRLGMDADAWGAIEERLMSRYDPDGNLLSETPVKVPGKSAPQLIHRVDLHEGLKNAAKKAGVALVLGNGAKSVDVDKGEVTLADGSLARGDVVLGADGIHSVVRRFVYPEGQDLQSTGCSLFRLLIPMEKAASVEKVRERFVRTKDVLTGTGDGHQMIITYPCRNAEILNVGAMFCEEDYGVISPDEDLRSRLLNAFSHFDEASKALLELASEVLIWRLWDIPELPAWVKGKAAVIGEAAHPIMPTTAQGGAQAIEDAVTLGVLLPRGTKPSEVAARLQLYYDIRHERVEWIQKYGRSALMQPANKAVTPLMNSEEFFKTCFKHDAWEYAESALDTNKEATVRL